MVVLADEILESFFETDFANTFRLEPVPLMEIPSSNSGLLGGIWQNIATDDNRKIFNRFTDEIGRAVGKHQVCFCSYNKAKHSFLTCSAGLHKTCDRQVHRAGGTEGARVAPYTYHAPLRVQSEPHISFGFAHSAAFHHRLPR